MKFSSNLMPKSTNLEGRISGDPSIFSERSAKISGARFSIYLRNLLIFTSLKIEKSPFLKTPACSSQSDPSTPTLRKCNFSNFRCAKIHCRNFESSTAKFQNFEIHPCPANFRLSRTWKFPGESCTSVLVSLSWARNCLQNCRFPRFQRATSSNADPKISRFGQILKRGYPDFQKSSPKIRDPEI